MKLSRTIEAKTIPAWLSYACFYAVFCNVPYWIASSEFGIESHRGLFCIDAVIAGILALAVPAYLTPILFSLTIAVDVFNGISESYSLSTVEIISNSDALTAMPHLRLAAGVIAVSLYLFLIAAALRIRSAVKTEYDLRRAALMLGVFGCIIFLVDTSIIISKTGRSLVHLGSATDIIDAGPRVMRKSALSLIRFELFEAHIRRMEAKGIDSAEPVPGATAAALDSKRGNQSAASPENVVLVLVESWGLSSNEKLRKALVQSYFRPEIQREFDVRQGVVRSLGNTVPAEARELCGMNMGFHLIEASDEELKRCLPYHLANLGYQDIAVHGMNGHLFHRSEWYKRIGFTERFFYDELKQQGLSDCGGALMGSCDKDIAKWIAVRLSANSTYPSFIYWVTLNSHLPVEVPSGLSDGAACSSGISLLPQTPLCSWYQLVANVHNSISEIAASELKRPTLFIIVGDHAPPFRDSELRGQFSQGMVPYILLIPRLENGAISVGQ